MKITCGAVRRHAHLLFLPAIAVGPLICIWTARSSAAQTQPDLQTTSGIVEAEIANGDLKPARFAKIFALPTQSADSMKNAILNVSGVLNEQRSKANDPSEKELIEIECLKGLVQLRPVFEKLKQAALENQNKPGGPIFTESDELGEFQLKGINSAPYTVFAIGKFGMNAGIWFLDSAPSSQPDRLKLTRPQVACYDPNGYFEP
jgi:hypothetical protein